MVLGPRVAVVGLVSIVVSSACGGPAEAPVPSAPAARPTRLTAAALPVSSIGAPTATGAPAVRGPVAAADGAGVAVTASPNAGGGSIGDPPEATQFDPDTAAGEGWLGDRLVRVRQVPEGCERPGGQGGRGAYTVTVSVLDAPGASLCAALGDVVEIQGVAVVFGTEGPDEIDATRIPTTGTALVFGFGGDDTIVLTSDEGGTVHAGSGNDRVVGGAGPDVLVGGPGDDTIAGNGGDDLMVGGEGNDALTGGPGADELYGNDGADSLDACPNDLAWDFLSGGAGPDTFRAAFLADHALESFEALEEGLDRLDRCQVVVPSR